MIPEAQLVMGMPLQYFTLLQSLTVIVKVNMNSVHNIICNIKGIE